MNTRGRLLVWSSLAVAAAGAAGPASANAAGNSISTKIKMSPASPKPGKKPAQVKLGLEIDIAKADGTREDALKTIDLTLPSGLVLDTSRYAVCPMDKLTTNKVAECPAKSLVGHHQAVLNGAPLIAAVHLEADVFVTRKTKTSIEFGAYSSAKELPNTHGVVPGTLKLSGGRVRLHIDAPRIPTAPGLPDGTNQSFDFQFDVRGSQGTLLRAKKPCKSAWALSSRLAFVDDSVATSTAKANC